MKGMTTCSNCGRLASLGRPHSCEPLGKVIELRPEVNEFALAIEKRVRRYYPDEWWKDKPLDYLEICARQRLQELELAIAGGNLDSIRESTVMAALHLMMIHDQAVKRKECGCDGGCR